MITRVVEPPPTKLAGVVIATLASTMATALPAVAAGLESPAGAAGSESLSLSPREMAPVPALSMPTEVLEAARPATPPPAKETEAKEGAGHFAPGRPAAEMTHSTSRRHLLDLNSDISDLVNVGDYSFTLNDYGPELGANKDNLLAGVQDAAGSFDEQCLVVAVSMLETNHMASSERDSGKDSMTDGSKNYSPLNVCVDLWNVMGITDVEWMNDANPDMRRLGATFIQGVRTVGLTEFVGFTRAGSGWQDPGRQESIQQYRHGLGTVIKQLQADPSLLTDTRRVDVSVPYLGS